MGGKRTLAFRHFRQPDDTGVTGVRCTEMRHVLLLPAAIILALASSFLERRGPDQGVYCAIGKVHGVEVYCPKPKLNGGWPAPYLFDREGVSVEWQLGFFEDDLRAWPFIADVSFYLLLLLSAEAAGRKLRQAIANKG